MKNLLENIISHSEYLTFQKHLISCMSAMVLSKISKSFYQPADVIKAYMIQQIVAEDDIDQQLEISYRSNQTGKVLPRYVYLEFDTEGTAVVDIIIIS